MKTSSKIVAATLLLITVSACRKSTPIPPPPPPPVSNSSAAPPPSNTNPQRPTVAEFTVEPSTIERGQSAILRWNVSGTATEVAINGGIGTVQATGTRRVIPAETTTYTLTANGPMGDATATATITVTGPGGSGSDSGANGRNGARGTLESRVQSDLKDAYFDYDSNNIRDDARAALTANADALKRIFADFPNSVVMVEGHCDERGSAEYNLGLGDKRSSAARDFLAGIGVSADRMKTISYGKERPSCTESDETCWQANRRAHFSVGQ